ncbi:MAG TPA: AAA family ATPase [Candidatus Limnocylindria bacterium]|nr:AAA family ATPase [Candidatus Limnocylindria bacterium]
MDSSPTADDLGGRSVFIDLPTDALVVLIGIAASGKTTFAARHFAPTQVLSSDAMRALIADDASAQGATDDAFELLHQLLEMRLRRGRLTVVDATNVEDWARAELLVLARRHRRPAVAVVLDLPLEIALRRNLERPAPRPPASALRRQHGWLHDTLHAIEAEGFAQVHHLASVEAIDSVRVRFLA